MGVAVAMLAACGSASSPAGPTPVSQDPPGPAGPPTITLSATGFTPQEVTVAVGGRVTFVNADRIGHDIFSGLEHNSPECAEVDAVGFLVAGQRRETSVFEQSKTCRFHDHENLGNPAYQGRIVAR
jgi:plastocyanin